MSFTRFAIYYVPDGDLASFGAAWLGWDATRGESTVQPDLPDIRDITMTPRKYGFHATLKPPFRLAPGCSPQRLQSAVAEVASRCAPARADGLTLSRLGRFLALTAAGDTSEIERVAGRFVTELDPFRDAATEAEISRRRAARLTERQDALLLRCGYPYVLEEFRFHMTVTGRLDEAEIPIWIERVAAHLPPLPEPFLLNEVALLGERADGCFELIQRYTLDG